MSDNIVNWPGVTRLDIPAERVLACEELAHLQEIVVIGTTADGDFYFASNKADGGAVLWLLEIAKRELMATQDDIE